MTPPNRTMGFTAQLAVPVAIPLPHRSQDHETCVTPTLSEAVPLRFRLPLDVLNVAVETGDVIAIDGGVVSGGVYVTVSVAEA